MKRPGDVVEWEERERLGNRAGVLSILMLWLAQEHAFMLAAVRRILLHEDVIVAVALEDLEKEMNVDRQAFQDYVSDGHRRN